MRRDSRKPRAFRPLEASLEPRNAVSSLVPGISAPHTAAWQPAKAPGAGFSPRAATSVNDSIQPTSLGQPFALTATPAPLGRTARSAEPSTTANPGQGSRALENLITFATPYTPSSAAVPLVTRPVSASFTSPSAGGASGVNPSSASSQPTASSMPESSTPTAPVVVGTPGANAPGAIRPLSLAATNTGDMAGYVQPTTGSGGSGGGPPVVDNFTLSPSGSGDFPTTSDLNNGPNNDEIGDSSGAVITNITGSSINEVQWYVNGALQSVTENDTQGTNAVALANPDTVQAFQGEAIIGLGFNWNAVPGNNNIEAVAFFANGQQVQKQVNVNVETPTLVSFQRSYQPLAMKPDVYTDPVSGMKTLQMTLMQGTRQNNGTFNPAGNSFVAVVSAKNMDSKLPAGSLYVKQTVIANSFQYYNKPIVENGKSELGVQWTNVNTTTGQATPNVAMMDGKTDALGGQSVAVQPGQAANITLTTADTPALPVDAASSAQAYSTGGVYFSKEVISMQFISYLTYKPANGVPVTLATMSWTVSATATFNPPPPTGNLATDTTAYMTPSNWNVVNPTPAAAGTQSGAASTANPTYTGNTQDNMNGRDPLPVYAN